MTIALPCPWKKLPPSFPATPSKSWGPVRPPPPFFENLVGGSTPPPPQPPVEMVGGEHYVDILILLHGAWNFNWILPLQNLVCFLFYCYQEKVLCCLPALKLKKVGNCGQFYWGLSHKIHSTLRASRLMHPYKYIFIQPVMCSQQLSLLWWVIH